MNKIFINFVNTGADISTSIYSIEHNYISKSMNAEILEKAIDRTKLVPKIIIDKNGRKKTVYVRPGEDVKNKVRSKKLEEKKQINIKFHAYKAQEQTKQSVRDATKNMKPSEVFEFVKSHGVAWEENSYEPINVMRAKSALFEAIEKHGVKLHDKNDTKKVENTAKTAQKVAEQPKKAVKQKKAPVEKTEKKPKITVVAKDKEHLKSLIKDRIKKSGTNCDLNDIDVSKVTDMHNLFKDSQFNGDISKWDVSNVTNMSNMFSSSHFKGDISKWNVSNVTDMSNMFSYSKFNGDISKWDVSNVRDMSSMFDGSKFNGDISKWDVSNVKNMESMFAYSDFNGDISKWDVSNVRSMSMMFSGSDFNSDISKWDVSNVENMNWMFRGSPLRFNPPIKPKIKPRKAEPIKHNISNKELRDNFYDYCGMLCSRKIFDLMGEEKWATTAKTLYIMNSKLPEVKNYIKTCETEFVIDASEKCIAYVTSDVFSKTKKLVITTNTVKRNINEFNKIYINDRNNNWHPDYDDKKFNGLEVSMVHEYGHIVQNYLCGKYGIFGDDIKIMCKHHKDEIIRIAKAKYGLDNEGKYKPVSRYGETNEREFFAECFANAMCGRPNAYGKAMIDFLTNEGVLNDAN